MTNLSNKFIELLLQKLPDEKVTELQILIEVGNSEKIQEYISSILTEIEKITSDNLKDLQ